jgi:hypothetical protein
MNKKIIIFFSLLHLITITTALISNDISFNERVRQQMERQFTKPIYLQCLPKSLIEDVELEKEFKNALLNKFSDINDGDIKKVIFLQNNWRISRDEFTSLVTYRYMFATAVIKQKNMNHYLVVSCVFIQSNRFLGFIFGKTFYKSILSVNKIKEENTGTICKQR